MNILLLLLILLVPIFNWMAFKRTNLRGVKRFLMYMVSTWIAELALMTTFTLHVM